MTVTPTSFDSAFGDLAREMIAESGRSLLLRQPTRVESQSGEDAGAVLSSPLSWSSLYTTGRTYEAFVETSPTIGASASAGATSIAVDFGVNQSGYLVPGDSFEIAGHPEPYVVVGDIYALGDEQTVFSSVSISPPLSSAVTAGETLAATYSADRDFEAAGATELDFEASGVAGLLIAGDVIEIDGESYTVSGGPYEVENDGLADVTVSPGLRAPVAVGSLASVAFSGTFTAIKGVVSSVSHRWIVGGVAKVGDLEILVSRAALEAAGVTLAVGDELHLGATAAAPLYAIEAVLPLASGEFDAAYTVIARAR